MANDSYGTFFAESKIPYDPLWQGPLKKDRRCTNRFWLIAFSAFIVIWAIVATHAFTNGDVQKLVVPTDSQGRKCGIDLDVQDKPYLLFFDLTKCANGSCNTTQVCRSQCPTENFFYQSRIGSLDSVKQNLICTIDINPNLITTWEQVDQYVTQKKCATWYLISESIVKRCIPKVPVPKEFNSTISNEQLTAARQTILQLAEFEKYLEEVYNDIVKTGYPILGFILLSGVAAFFYIILLRWFAKPFVYASILIICALLVYFVYASSVQYSITNNATWIYFLVACIVSLLVVILSTIFLHRKIALACQIIKESSKAVTCLWSSLLFPVLPWILHVLVLTLAVGVFLYLRSIVIPNYQFKVQELVANTCSCPQQLNYITNATCDPVTFKAECKDINGGPCVSAGCYISSTTVPGQVYVYHIINAVAFLWLTFFVSAFGQMVLATGFATWYWTYNKRDVPNFTVAKSLWITSRYHVGTLAFGALITWFCDIVRIILKPVAGSSNNGPMSVQPVGCIRSLVDYLMSFLQYINRNAYTMCAIHGRGFCRSAKDAFNLIMRNILNVVVITNITDWLLKIAKYFIILVTVGFTAAFYSNKVPEVNNIEVPLILAFIGSCFITSVFFAVHKSAVDTLFLCFLEDTERNDDSQERPYYMSIRLRELLRK